MGSRSFTADIMAGLFIINARGQKQSGNGSNSAIGGEAAGNRSSNGTSVNSHVLVGVRGLEFSLVLGQRMSW